MNKIVCIDSLDQEHVVNQIPGVRIVTVGDNNLIKFYEGTKFENCEFVMNSNCKVTFGSSIFKIRKIRIFMNSFCEVEVAENFSCLEADFRLQENNTFLVIGRDCMFSSEIKIYASDGHAIFSLSDPKQAINLGGGIRIGNHVWIGRNVCLLKNTQIGSNSVVGYGSVVTKNLNVKILLSLDSLQRLLRQVLIGIENPQNYLTDCFAMSSIKIG